MYSTLVEYYQYALPILTNYPIHRAVILIGQKSHAKEMRQSKSLRYTLMSLIQAKAKIKGQGGKILQNQLTCRLK